MVASGAAKNRTVKTLHTRPMHWVVKGVAGASKKKYTVMIVTKVAATATSRFNQY